MSFNEVLGIAIAVFVLIGLPAFMIYGAVDHFRTPASKRRGGSAPVGGALLELDCLVARPSVEHVVEAQTAAVRETEQDGE